MPKKAGGGPFQGHWFLRSGFKHGLPVPLPHVGLAGVDPYRVVHDAVEDGVDDGAAAEAAVAIPWSPIGWRTRR